MKSMRNTIHIPHVVRDNFVNTIANRFTELIYTSNMKVNFKKQIVSFGLYFEHTKQVLQNNSILHIGSKQ